MMGRGDKKSLNWIISIDDGYVSWMVNGLPVFERYSVAPLLFVNSGYLDLPDSAALEFCLKNIGTWFESGLRTEHLKELDLSGAEIGSHSFAHLDMSNSQLQDSIDDLAMCKTTLEDVLSREVRFFAYPFGRVSKEAVNAVESVGFSYAFSTRSGYLEESESNHMLCRTNVGLRLPSIVFAYSEGYMEAFSALVKKARSILE